MFVQRLLKKFLLKSAWEASFPVYKENIQYLNSLVAFLILKIQNNENDVLIYTTVLMHDYWCLLNITQCQANSHQSRLPIYPPSNPSPTTNSKINE